MTRSEAAKKIDAMRAQDNRKARRKKVLWISAIFIIVAALVGAVGYAYVNRPTPPPPTATGEQLTPKRLTADGFYNILPGGAVGTGKEEQSATLFSVLLDPQCPGCGSFERSAGSYLQELNTKGEIAYRVSPLNFLDSMSTDNYSARAANALVTVAEQSPEHFSAFMDAIFKTGNQPGEGAGYRSVSDEKIAQWATQAGVPAEVAANFQAMSYKDWLQQHTETMGQRTELFPQGLSTPGIFVGGKVEDNKTPGAQRVELTDDIQGSIQKAIANAQ